jgi:hypothetical protein
MSSPWNIGPEGVPDLRFMDLPGFQEIADEAGPPDFEGLAEYGVKPEVVDACTQGLADLLNVGLPSHDIKVQREAEKGLSQTADRYKAYYGVALRGYFFSHTPLGPYGQHADPHELREITKMQARLFENGHSTGPSTALGRQAVKDLEKGIRRSITIPAMLSSFCIHYGAETASNIFIDTAFLTDAETYMSYRDNKVSAREIAQRARRHRPADLSNETLDARSHTLLAVSSFEISRLVLDEIGCLGSLGAARLQQARKLFARYRPKAGDADLAHKLNTLGEIEAIYREYAWGPNQLEHHNASGFAELLTNGARKLTGDMRNWLEFVGDVYDALGYEKPSALLEALGKPESGQSVPVPLRDVVVVEAPAPVRADESVAAAVHEQAAGLANEADATFNQWRLNPSQCKKLNFRDTHTRLTKGYSDKTGELTLQRQDIAMAYGIIGVLRGLAFISRREPEAAIQSFEDIIAAQRHMQASIRELHSEAIEKHVSGVEYPEIPPIERTVESTLTEENWPALRELILETWPAGKTPEQAPLAVADRIGGLLSAIRARQANPQ